MQNNDSLKLFSKYSKLLSEVSTSISRALSSKGVMDFFMGDSASNEDQVVLFRPVLMENIALLCHVLKGKSEIVDLLIQDSSEVAEGLGLKLKDFIAKREEDYSKATNLGEVFTAFCVFVGNNRRNAETLGSEDESQFKPDYQNNGVRAIQLAAQTLLKCSDGK